MASPISTTLPPVGCRTICSPTCWQHHNVAWTLTRHVRSTASLSTLPVVVVSTRNRPEDRLGALHAGADAYLVKQGLDALELATVVRRLGGR